MSLLDQLRDAQAEPARHRTSPFAGPSILTLEQLRAMERVLLREMPGYGEPEVEPLALWSPPASVAPPPAAIAQSPEPITIDLTDDPPTTYAEPLPLWTAAPAPSTEPRAPVTASGPARRQPNPCPSCGEAVSIGRIDLTANASWFSCRRCGHRWGGAIERPEAERTADAS
jgi:ribosomal protein L37AE/L43A